MINNARVNEYMLYRKVQNAVHDLMENHNENEENPYWEDIRNNALDLLITLRMATDTYQEQMTHDDRMEVFARSVLNAPRGTYHLL